MTRIRVLAISMLALLLGLWLAADRTLSGRLDFAALHLPLLNLSGILLLGAMSACMLLALRSSAINKWLGGLDKSYRLHKWLGIVALVVGLAHWALVKVPQLAFQWPALEQPPAPGHTVLDFFQQQYGVAVQLGDTGFKLFVILVVLALVKRFPYRYFFKTHRLLAVVFLGVAFHGLVLLEFDYWDDPVAWVMLALVAGGVVSALVSLFRRIGVRRRVVGEIDELVWLDEGQVLRAVIAFKEQWPGHEAGQFAFVTFDRKEGPHPFTIASPWTNNGKLFFLIKGLGDYTRELHEHLAKGDYVEVEGPYGQFNFSSGRQDQIWVAGGIGIAPFVSRAKQLAEQGASGGTQVDLFYSAAAVDERMLKRIRQSSKAAGINLHLVVPQRDGHLDFARIKETVPRWREADIWFCGPSEFGSQLKKDAVSDGVAACDFHQELFEMR